MKHARRLSVLGSLLAVSVCAQSGSPDPAFARVPFAQWLAESQRSPFQWTPRIPPAVLSFHQRLMMRFTADIDGIELANRRGRGELVIFTQITDQQGRVYQDHGAIPLLQLEEGAKSSRFAYTQTAFLLPGEYEVAMAVYDTASHDHSVRKEKLRVAPLKRDPWPDAWRDLPAVEFVDRGEGTDDLFLPGAHGRLHIAVNGAREAKSPVAVEVMVNVTPSEDNGSPAARMNNLRMMIPTLKVMSQMEPHNAALNLSVLDLARQRVPFHQENIRELDWPRLRDALLETNSGTIALRSLAHRGEEAVFFEKQLSHRMELAAAAGSPCALVILSGVMAFGAGEDLERMGGKPGACRVFYIRFHVPVIRTPFAGGENRGRHKGFDPREMGPPPPRADQLEATLKPLNPRLFDVESAEETRAALAEIWAEVSRE